jgi:hypothetical protein
MNTKSTGDRWALCKAMAALTGVPSPVFFKHFVALSEDIANAALTQPDTTQDPTAVNALRDHINALKGADVELPTPAQPLPTDPPDPAPEEVPSREVAEYVQRLRLALWLIVQCGGVEQAKFIVDQASKAFPADTSPAFTHLKK